ncbi:type 2 lanthipeptide synthetase LanM [Sneathiella marina]|uniref:Type 2 lanthipeptide synthetase LanM n=1 Tax=Sneathiella marina TaxID=2950108 RepID=A0ABY4W3U8_9PROT|nr:type 2 lanthipeptide synthetase LanM [Sneathiella marina]USG61584.1 type 2 lanthipeptide synthetase LanM [Sneathiella marina]
MTAQATLSAQITAAGPTFTREAFTIEELKTLAARASTLEERLSGHFAPKKTKRNYAIAKSRYNAWVKSTSRGDPFLMSDILADRNIDPAKAKPLFGEVVLNCDQPLPEWAIVFSQLVAGPVNKKTTKKQSSSTPKSLFPYEQIFFPLVKNARHMRDMKAKDIWLQNLSCEALSDLDFSLLEPISDCCIKSIDDVGENYGNKSGMSSNLPSSQEKTARITECHRQKKAIQVIEKEGLDNFLYNRPVLARLITTMIMHWQATTLEFLERLSQDLSTEIFSLTKIDTPGRVVSIEYGLSELYNEGKSIYKLTFENNISIGYKPKDLRIDRAWGTLIQWLNDHGAPYSAGVPKTRVCNGYGWVEWIVPKPCETQSEAEEFFRRSGATLCLIRLLHGNDFHYGNIIASGTKPVPLDLETVFQAQPKRSLQSRGAEQAFELASDIIENSVLNTGYLPGWYSAPNGKAIRLGGLDIAEISSVPSNNHPTHAQEAPKKGILFNNIPRLQGAVLDVNKYEKYLVAGYKDMFAFLIKFGSRIGASGGPLDAFEKVTFRSILRPTHVYTMLMERALSPQNLENGVTWSSQFDLLLLSEFTQEEFNASAAFRNYEISCLSTFNIPFYSGSPTSTSLACGDQYIIKNFFRAPCLEQAKSRLQELDSKMLKRDRLMIQQCVSVSRIGEPHDPLPEVVESPLAPASKETIIETVRDLEEVINMSAIKAGGGVTWLGLLPVTSDEQKLQLSILPPSLICGTLGIGLLQAALYKITGEETYRIRATETTAIVLERASMIVKLQRSGCAMSLGLGFGLGGIVYALVVLADMLNDSRYLSFAQVFAQTITPEKIATSRDFGLMSGVAGAMIGLQAFYHRYPSPEIVHKIRNCGRHLLDCSTLLACGSTAWKSQNWAMPLSGLMHGASGIALALSRAAQALNLPQFNDAAIEGLEYESSLRDKFGSWPDLRNVEHQREDSQAPQLPGYANGAAGIGIARIELEALNRPYASYSEDIEHAIERLSGRALLDNDDLFSGNLGILFFLTRAARETGKCKLEKQVLSQISCILAKAKTDKSFQWRVGNDADNPGFFNGAAGVGLALLQIAEPGKIPDILSFGHCGQG